MGEAQRDNNRVTTLIAVSSSDGVTPVTLYADPTTHRLLVSATAGDIDDLSNVTITSAAQGDILYYNGSAWVNLAPGTSGNFLKTQGAGANPIWDTPSAGAAGTDTQVQFNDGGSALGGDAGFVYNKTSNVATIGGMIISGLTASLLVATDGSKNLVSLATTTYPSLTELSYVKGVTSAIQTQLGTKAPLTSPTFETSILGNYLTASTVLIADGSKNIISATTATYPSLTEFAYVKGVTSAIQTQLNAKAPADSPTFTTQVTGSYLTASEILITDASKNVVSAPVATYPSLTELAYVKGVTSAIQTQLGTKAPLASPTFTGTVTLPVGLTGVLRADSGVVSTDSDVTDLVTAADLTTAGKIEVATSGEVNTGTDAGRAVSPDGLAGSNFGIRYMQAIVFDFATDVATGDGKFYFHIPAGLNGMNLVEVHAEVISTGTTNSTTIQINNVTQAADMLTALLEIETGESGSDTSDPGPTIDTNNDDVATNDVLRIDVDSVSTTAPKGLIVTLGFQLP